LNTQILLDLNSTTDGNYSAISWNGSSSDLGTGVYSAEIRGYREASAARGAITFNTRDAIGGDNSSKERVRITNAGNTGIGTTAPLDRLHIASTGECKLIIGNEQTNTDGIKRSSIIKKADNNLEIRATESASSSETIFTRTSSAESARIDSSGRLLLNTSTSRAVASTTGGVIQVNGAFASYRRYSNNVAAFAIAIGKSRSASEGTNTVVQSGDAIGEIRFAGDDGTDLESQAAAIKCEVDGTPGTDDMPGRLVFSTTADSASSPTERMRITNGGKFLFNSTNANAEYYFYKNSNVNNLRVDNAVSDYTGINVWSVLEGANNADTDCQHFQGYTGNTARFIVYGNGNVQNSNNSYGSISDIKLKENIVDASSQWEDLKALQVRKYNFKEETGQQTHNQIGLVAQEAELVSPGLVSESPDRDAEGNDLGTVTKSVNYSVLYMKAVKALQEAMERIETLEAKVAALESV
jgi:hypothetical protein